MIGDREIVKSSNGDRVTWVSGALRVAKKAHALPCDRRFHGSPVQ